MEIDISKIVPRCKNKMHERADLSHLVRESSRAIQRGLTSKDKADNRASTIANVLPYFATAFYAVGDRSMDAKLFAADHGTNFLMLKNSFAAYNACNAAQNLLLDDKLLEMLKQHGAKGGHYGNPQLSEKSEHSYLLQALAPFKETPVSQGIVGTQFNLYGMLEGLKSHSLRFVRTKASADTKSVLNDVHFVGDGFDFTNTKYKTTPKQQLTATVDDTITVAEYVPKKWHQLDKVVAEDDAKILLKAAMIRLLKYDTHRMQNPFNADTQGFRPAHLLHGPPGVGKNMTVDGVINHFRQKYDVSFQALDLCSGISSKYLNESAAKLEASLQLQNDGDKRYLNVVDEVDGLLGLRASGEIHQEDGKVLRILKSHIDGADQGNKLYMFLTNYPETLEAAFLSKSISVPFSGPQTVDDFVSSFKVALGEQTQKYSESQLTEMGKICMANKQQYAPATAASNQEIYTPVTHRDVYAIVSPLMTIKPELLVANEEAIMRASYTQTCKIIKELRNTVGPDDLLQATHQHFADKIAAKSGATAAYNRR